MPDETERQELEISETPDAGEDPRLRPPKSDETDAPDAGTNCVRPPDEAPDAPDASDEPEEPDEAKNPDAPRIAVFYATVGTGHKAAAEALADWCRAEYPDAEVLCRDLLDYVPRWIRWCVTRAYLFMARRAPWMWGRLYAVTDHPPKPGWRTSFWDDLHKTVSRVYLRYLFEEVDAFDPTAILVTHFFGMSALLDRWEHRTPIYYVDTDYISHAQQRDPRFDGWFVASDESIRQHQADGIPSPETKVRNCGIPIARVYSDLPTREAARKKLDIDEAATSVLIAGGGIGAGALDAVADSLLSYAQGDGWHVEILCGSNRGLYEVLRDKYFPFKNVVVRKFIHNIYDYYMASDVVVLKPGGLSSAEVAACGCAIMLLDPLPGQEQYNCDYLLERGAARRIYEVRRVGEQIAELMRRPEELARIRAGAKALGRPNAAREILRAVVGE